MRTAVASAAVFWGCMVLLLCAAAPEPEGFDLALFHQHAVDLHHTITATPTCVGHDGVRGLFVMETPRQEFLPFSVTTIIGPGGISSNLTTNGDLLSDGAADDIGAVLNDQAEKIVAKIITDCESEDS